MKHTDRERTVEGCIVEGKAMAIVRKVRRARVGHCRARDHVRSDIDSGDTGHMIDQVRVRSARPATNVQQAQRSGVANAPFAEQEQFARLESCEEIDAFPDERDR